MLSTYALRGEALRGGEPGEAGAGLRRLANFTLAFEGERFRGVDVEVVEEMEERNRMRRLRKSA